MSKEFKYNLRYTFGAITLILVYCSYLLDDIGSIFSLNHRFKCSCVYPIVLRIPKFDNISP